jgi:hypothetical protein
MTQVSLLIRSSLQYIASTAVQLLCSTKDFPMNFLQERSVRAAKKEIDNILNSYHHYWDVLAELLQNARDAINRRQNAGNNSKGVIRLEVDVQSRSITLFDNGIGIGKSLIRDILSPGSGDKDDRHNELGEKGVGITFCIFSGNKFELISRGEDGKLHGGSVSDGYDWVMSDNFSECPSYDYMKDEDIPPELLEHDIQFGEDHYDCTSFTQIRVSHIRKLEDDVDIFDKTIDQLLFILQTRSILGNTKKLWESTFKHEFDFHYRLRVPDSSSKFQSGRLETGYPLMHELAQNHSSLAEVQNAFISKSTRLERRKFLKDKTVYSILSKKLGNNKELKVYGVMFPGNKIFDSLALNTLKLVPPGSSDSDEIEEIFRSGIFVSTKGMPTGIEIAPAKGGRYPAYYRRCLFIVDYDGLKFDVGRKTINNYWKKKLRTAVAELFADMELVAPYQTDDHFKPTGPNDPIETAAERKARKKMEWDGYEKLVDLGIDRIKYAKEPSNQEAAVAAIFHELLGASVLEHYEPLSTGYGTRYDLHCNYYSNNNSIIQLVIEFKHSLETIIKDFEENKKFWQDMDMIVAWDADKQKLKNSGFLLEDVNHSPYEGCTHKLEIPMAGTDELPILLLKSFVEKMKSTQS